MEILPDCALAHLADRGSDTDPADGRDPAGNRRHDRDLRLHSDQFLGYVDIINNGPAINGWTLRWTFITPTSDIQGWLAVIAVQGGNRATATTLSWNGTIPTGATASFGWNAKANSTAVPTDLTINGEPC